VTLGVELTVELTVEVRVAVPTVADGTALAVLTGLEVGLTEEGGSYPNGSQDPELAPGSEREEEPPDLIELDVIPV
jgi:hypothetical protein